MARYLLSLVMLAGIAGCAPASTPTPAVQPTPVGTGTILSMRAVEPHADVEPLRAALLTDGSGQGDDNRAMVEFIVRADDGATLSIVQSNAAAFRKGDRVVILHGDRTRLARPG